MSTGNASGVVLHVNQTPVSGANVSMFTAGGALVTSGQSGVDGRFEFRDIAVGSYYVTIYKQLFKSNQSSVFNVNSNMTADIGYVSLEYLDVNRDGEVNVLDLDLIYSKRFRF